MNRSRILVALVVTMALILSAPTALNAQPATQQLPPLVGKVTVIQPGTYEVSNLDPAGPRPLEFNITSTLTGTEKIQLTFNSTSDMSIGDPGSTSLQLINAGSPLVVDYDKSNKNSAFVLRPNAPVSLKIDSNASTGFQITVTEVVTIQPTSAPNSTTTTPQGEIIDVVVTSSWEPTGFTIQEGDELYWKMLTGRDVEVLITSSMPGKAFTLLHPSSDGQSSKPDHTGQHQIRFYLSPEDTYEVEAPAGAVLSVFLTNNATAISGTDQVRFIIYRAEQPSAPTGQTGHVNTAVSEETVGYVANKVDPVDFGRDALEPMLALAGLTVIVCVIGLAIGIRRWRQGK